VKSIDAEPFYGCTSLTSIVIPEGVTSIGDLAFLGCTGLTSIVIPEGVTSIGDMAFWGCISLTSIVIAGLDVSNINVWLTEKGLADNMNVKRAVYRGMTPNLLANCYSLDGSCYQIQIGKNDMPIGAEYEQGADLTVYAHTPEGGHNPPPMSLYFRFSPQEGRETVLLDEQAGYQFKRQGDGRYLLYQKALDKDVAALYVDFMPDYSNDRFILLPNLAKPVVMNEEVPAAAAAAAPKPL
jgi:hypothetical protein